MFNIVTPTYNRAHTLHRVLQSLLQQTYTKFKWIIVDDCSTDKTFELIDKWKKTYPEIHIEYYFLKKNEGKSNAVNFGLNKCHYPYTIIADSDDSFISNTLCDLRYLWRAIELTDQKNKVACIWTLVKDEVGQLVGDQFPKDFWQVSFKERILKNNIIGEKWHCWRTAILKKQSMYLVDNCHVPESVTWNAINRDYDFLCVNVFHRVYFHSNDGLIATKVDKIKAARAYFYGSFFELDKASIYEILLYGYYRTLAFDFVKSTFYFSNKKMNFSFVKNFFLFLIFLFKLPKRLFSKIS